MRSLSGQGKGTGSEVDDSVTEGSSLRVRGLSSFPRSLPSSLSPLRVFVGFLLVSFLCRRRPGTTSFNLLITLLV